MPEPQVEAGIGISQISPARESVEVPVFVAQALLESQKTSRAPFRFWILSLGVHFLLFFFLGWVSKFYSSDTPSSLGSEPRATVLPLRTLSESALSQRILGAKPVDKETLKIQPQDTAKFLSDKTRRVPKQGTVRELGISQPPGPRGDLTQSFNSSGQNSQSKVVKPTETPSGRLFLPGAKSPQDSYPKVKQNPLASGSLIPQGVTELIEDEDIAARGELLLNTDEYKYASFYQRLSRELYPIWYERVENRVDRKEVRRFDQLHTRILVFVNRQGEVQKLQTDKASGCRSCDLVASESLLNLGSMQNPPSDRLGPDGNYSFYVNFLITTQGRPSWVRVSPEADPPKFWDPRGQAR